VEVFDVYGKRHASRVTRNDNTSHSSSLISIDISELKAGIYFVKIITDKSILTKKIIKY
jgi:uncharacterized protein (DUF2141 family)